MKKLEELGISPTPWASCCGICADNKYRADSRLMAAAPELYEACRKLCIAFKNRLPSKPTIEELELIVAAATALEKAGGAE